MAWVALHRLKQRFNAAAPESRAPVLFASEAIASPGLIDFLIEVAGDADEYDLARIEAVKAAGLAGLRVPSRKRRVVDGLLALAFDADEDVQLFALQSLEFYAATFDDIARVIEPLTHADEPRCSSALAVLARCRASEP